MSATTERTYRYIETWWWRLREPITANLPVKSLSPAPDEIAGEIALDYETIHVYALGEGVTPGLDEGRERRLWKGGKGYLLEDAIAFGMVRSVADDSPEYKRIDANELWMVEDWDAIGGGY